MQSDVVSFITFCDAFDVGLFSVFPALGLVLLFMMPSDVNSCLAVRAG